MKEELTLVQNSCQEFQKINEELLFKLEKNNKSVKIKIRYIFLTFK